MASEVTSNLNHSVKDVLGNGQSHLRPWEKVLKETTVKAVARHTKHTERCLSVLSVGLQRGS